MLFFASAREAAAAESTEVEAPGDTMQSDDLLAQLTGRFPKLEAVLRACVLAINHEYVDQGTVQAVRDGDEVAIIPPLSGG